MEYPINTAGHGLVVVQLLGLSGVAEEAGSYEAAYHAAMAALHAGPAASTREIPAALTHPMYRSAQER